jgi:predicted dehydrogenase
MSAKLKIGVVGLGMGNAHINGFKKHPSCEVVAIADPDEARLKLRGDSIRSRAATSP